MANPHDLQKLVQDAVQRMHKRRVSVAVVGDIVLDNAIEGTHGGRHPEIGVSILREATAQESMGGAANIALALSRLGVEVSLFGIIGSDLHGRQLENLLDRQSFHHSLVVARGWPTPHKDWIYQRQANRHTLLHRIDYDKPAPPAAREEMVGEFRARCHDQVDVVILVDHGQGSIGPESLALVGLAKERKAQLVAIPRTTVLRGQPLNAVVLNPAEMRGLCASQDGADPRVLAGAYARDNSQHVYMSLLQEGFLVCQAGRADGILIPGYPLENPHWEGVRDITAAIVALGLALGLDPVDNGKFANAFRHLVAEQRGNGRIQWRDVFRFVGLPEDFKA